MTEFYNVYLGGELVGAYSSLTLAQMAMSRLGEGATLESPRQRHPATCELRSPIPFRRTERMLEVAEWPKTDEETWSRKFHFDNWIEPTFPTVVPTDFQGKLE